MLMVDVSALESEAAALPEVYIAALDCHMDCFGTRLIL